MAVPLPVVGGGAALMDAEILILGGGAAGSAAAIILARAGRSVLVLERERAAREKVCGEFLGADTAGHLARLGISPAALGGVALHRAQIAHGNRLADHPLPFTAWGLPRSTLDEALLAEAAQLGAAVLRGATAQGLMPEKRGWGVRLGDGRLLYAPLLVLATGKHDLRGQPRASGTGSVGLKLHLRLQAPPAGIVLFPLPGGYAGLQPSTHGRANLCVALSRGAAPGPARSAEALLAFVADASVHGTHLLRDAEPVTNRALAIAGIPYGFRHAAPADESGLYRVGDQLSVIHSLAGSGVAMALASGIGAGEAILAAQPAGAFHAQWRRRVSAPMRWAGTAAGVLAAMPGLSTQLAAQLPRGMAMIARHTRVA